MSFYLRSDSFVREYKQKRVYNGSVAPTTDYDLLDYIVRVLKVIYVRLNRCGNHGIEMAIHEGVNTNRILKSDFDEMRRTWWSKTLEDQLAYGTPEAVSWIYEANEAFSDWSMKECPHLTCSGAVTNPFNREKEDCRVLRDYHRRRLPNSIINPVKKRHAEDALNNPNVGVFEAFVRGEYANSRPKEKIRRFKNGKVLYDSIDRP